VSAEDAASQTMGLCAHGRIGPFFFFFYLGTGCGSTHKPSILRIGIFTELRVNYPLCAVCRHTVN